MPYSWYQGFMYILHTSAIAKLFAWKSYHVVWWVVGGGNCIYVQLTCDAYLHQALTEIMHSVYECT